jgi:hypothetical protein
MIWLPENHFQNHDQGSDICQVDAFIGDKGLDLCDGLTH